MIPFIHPQEDTPQQALKAIQDDFDLFPDWAERYEYLIDLGQKLPIFPDSYKTDNYRIFGCQSQVWILHDNVGGRLFFLGTSDSSIVAGLIALLLRIFSGRTPQEILSVPLSFTQDLGLLNALSSTRGNGLMEMIKYIQKLAEHS